MMGRTYQSISTPADMRRACQSLIVPILPINGAQPSQNPAQGKTSVPRFPEFIPGLDSLTVNIVSFLHRCEYEPSLQCAWAGWGSSSVLWATSHG